jgi:hypothetical protein
MSKRGTRITTGGAANEQERDKNNHRISRKRSRKRSRIGTRIIT